jgi:hypothetical protein
MTGLAAGIKANPFTRPAEAEKKLPSQGGQGVQTRPTEDVEKEIKSLLHDTISKLQLGGTTSKSSTSGSGKAGRHHYSQSNQLP